MRCVTGFGLTSGLVVVFLSLFARSGYAAELYLGSTLDFEKWSSTQYSINGANVDFQQVSRYYAVNYAIGSGQNSFNFEFRFGKRDFSADSYTPPERATGTANAYRLTLSGRHYFSQGSTRPYADIGFGTSSITTHVVGNSAANASLHGLAVFASAGMDLEFNNFYVVSVESRLGEMSMKDRASNKIRTSIGEVGISFGVGWSR